MAKKKLTIDEIVERLDELNDRWPKSAQLISWSGTLVLVDWSNHDPGEYEMTIPSSAIVPDSFPNIRNEGGDPDTDFDGDYHYDE